MKNNKIYKLLGILFLGLVFLMSCDNDPVQAVDITEGASNGNDLEVIVYDGSTTIAVIANKQEYRNLMADLEGKVETWDDEFVAKWGHLDDDALNAKEEELSFDSEKPFTDFENQSGLGSLRQKYLAAEEAWLNNEELDEATDPDNDPLFSSFDESDMAVLNKLAEIQIGTTIYKQLNAEQITLINNAVTQKRVQKNIPKVIEGSFLKIKDADYKTLIAFNKGAVSVIDNNNVSIGNNTDPSASKASCDYGKTTRVFKYPASRRRIKAIVKVPQPKFGSIGKVKTKMKSYKRRGRGWKKWRTSIATWSEGKVYDFDCSTFDLLTGSVAPVRRKRRVSVWRNPFFASHNVKNGEIIGVFLQNGIITRVALTW